MCIKGEMSCGMSETLWPLDEMKGYDWGKWGKKGGRENEAFLAANQIFRGIYNIWKYVLETCVVRILEKHSRGKQNITKIRLKPNHTIHIPHLCFEINRMHDNDMLQHDHW